MPINQDGEQAGPQRGNRWTDSNHSLTGTLAEPARCTGKTSTHIGNARDSTRSTSLGRRTKDITKRNRTGGLEESKSLCEPYANLSLG